MTYQWQIAPGFTAVRSGVTVTVHLCRALDDNGELVMVPNLGGLYGCLTKVSGLLSGLSGTATLTSGTLPAIADPTQFGGMPASAVNPSGTVHYMGFSQGSGYVQIAGATTGGPGTGGGWIEPNQWYFNEFISSVTQPYPEEVWVAYDPWADYPNSATPPPTFP